MAATTQQQLLSNILPKVIIEKITLTSNTDDTLKVDLNLTIKETLDDDLFGTWFDEINLNKYILIDVVQSKDSSVTEALSFSNDMIQLCNFTRPFSSDDMRVKALSYITKEKQLNNLISLLKEKTERKTISISKNTNGDSEITNYSSYINNDGKKIYEIPYKVSFSLNNNKPEHLAYFVVTSIDIDSLCKDYKIDYNFMNFIEEGGKTLSEIVIDNFEIVGYSFIYVDSSGNIWDGPVHKSPNGIWKTGEQETADSFELTRTTITNTKIEDFRNIKEIEKKIFDFTILEKLFSRLNLAELQSLDLSSTSKKESVFSELFLSRNSDGDIRFMFSIDFFKILKLNSSFSKLFDSNNQRFKQDAILNTKINSIKIWRRRVKNNVKLDPSKAEQEFEKFDNNEPDELIIMSSDLSWKNFLDKENQKGSITELDIQTSEQYNSIRYFTGMDKTMSSVTDGMYTYYVELDIEDGIADYIETRINTLEATKNTLVTYYTDISKPSMKKFFINTSNPHIESPEEKSITPAIMDYGYDPQTNKLSNQLIQKLNKKYPNSISAPWVIGSSVFVDILDIFSEIIKTQSDRYYFINVLFIFLNPTSGNPSSVLKVIELYDYLISSISKLTNMNPKSSINNMEPSSTVSSKGNRIFKTIKNFNNIIDSNLSKNYGIDYLATTSISINNTDGLAKITSDLLFKRVQDENSKFFNTETPNFSFNSNGKNINIKNIEDSYYSYLTPTRIDFPAQSVMLSPVDIKKEQNGKKSRNIKSLYDDGKSHNNSKLLQALMMEQKQSNVSRTAVQTRAYIPESSKLATEQKKQEKEIINKFMNLFSSYSGLTIESVVLNQPENTEEKDNKEQLFNEHQSLNNFFSALSLTDVNKNIYNERKAVFSKTNKSVKPHISTAKKLFKKDVNEIIQTGDTITGFQHPIKTDDFKKLPNQLKGLISKTSDFNSNMKLNLNYSDFKNTAINDVINHFHYEMIMEVQYLIGFRKTATGEILLNNPIWRTLTKQNLDKFIDGKQLFCRIKPYENIKIGVQGNKETYENCYDKYFIIVTKKIRSTQKPAETKNLFIDKLIKNIQTEFPGVELAETTKISNRAKIPEIIEIIKIDKDKNKDRKVLKYLPAPFKQDIEKASNIKLVSDTVPVSSAILANALSLEIQNKNISNNIKNNNHIPSDNIRNMNKQINKNIVRTGRGRNK